MEFQSTHPYRVRLTVCNLSMLNPCFNPHTHTGCDVVIGLICKTELAVSIHTPIQGVTHEHEQERTQSDVSIHTPIQGVTAYSAKG